MFMSKYIPKPILTILFVITIPIWIPIVLVCAPFFIAHDLLWGED